VASAAPKMAEAEKGMRPMQDDRVAEAQRFLRGPWFNRSWAFY
jgi:hypothetical protein